MGANKLKDTLGLQEGMRTHFSHAPVEYFEKLDMRAAPNRGADGDGVYEFIHAFFSDIDQLTASVDILASKLADDGILWISYPRSSNELSKESVIDAFTAAGVTPKETIEIIADWQGTKFVV